MILVLVAIRDGLMIFMVWCRDLNNWHAVECGDKNIRCCSQNRGCPLECLQVLPRVPSSILPLVVFGVAPQEVSLIRICLEDLLDILTLVTYKRRYLGGANRPYLSYQLRNPRLVSHLVALESGRCSLWDQHESCFTAVKKAV